ncbi:MAG TPA: cytochrome c [Nitrospiraceae bacterium]|nr:cytochrome c [Nitrospiraceae bacterium]
MRTVEAERFVAFLLLLGVMTLGAAAAGADNPASLDRGKMIYQSRCLECHGPEGRGDGEKAPFLSPRPGSLVSAATSAKSDRELLRTIQNGKPRTAMPAWKDILTEEEIREVLEYVRSLVRFSRPLTPAPPAQ